MSGLLLRAVALTVAVTCIAVVSAGGRAAAHTALQASAPAAGAVLAQAPEVVLLTFSEAVHPQSVQVAVTGPDGRSITSAPATVDGPVVRQPVRVSADGPHVVAYRVVSGDGHPVTGRLGFAYDAGSVPRTAESSPTGPPRSTWEAPAARDDDRDDDSILWWWAIALGVAAVGVQVAFLVFIRHRERRNDR
ncbi:copper resistance protein CopC [Geodermatophilus sp. SYSU D00703]